MRAQNNTPTLCCAALPLPCRELIPAAFRYDRKDFYASGSVVVGMVVMAASLLLFQI